MVELRLDYLKFGLAPNTYIYLKKWEGFEPSLSNVSLALLPAYFI